MLGRDRSLRLKPLDGLSRCAVSVQEGALKYEETGILPKANYLG